MTRNKEAQAAMSARKLFYLGPQGTFTHQAAVNASQALAHWHGSNRKAST